MNSVNISNFKWNWTEFCGDKTFQIWIDNHQDLSYCFQLLCLQTPVLSSIAIFSAYYSGKYGEWIVRTSREKFILKCRMTIVLLLALIPAIELFVYTINDLKNLLVINYGFAVVACCCWFVHFCYVAALRNRLGTSLRGPVILNSLWIMFYIICIIHIRSLYLEYQKTKSQDLMLSLTFIVVSTILQTFYGFSLIPSEDSPSRRSTSQDLDQDDVAYNSLMNRYVRFREDLDPHYIGTAMEGSSFMSRFFFKWVNLLINKGANDQLQVPDDVFDLPDPLSASTLHDRLNAVRVIRTSDEHIQAHLLISLHRTFGREFYGVGVLKFVADVAGFACPLLLYELLCFIDDPTMPVYYGYLYSGGIFIATIIGSFCDVHFDFFIGKITLKLQAALITTIYRKMLRLHLSVFRRVSLGEVINHMSVDMERISNSCVSVHSVWSIPLKLLVTLYLLYLQVGYASLIGVVCSIFLIPVNKYIALKIGKYSARMMEEKDKRVGIMSEFIKGMRVIKLHVWEDYFLCKVFGIRAEEVRYLKYRKYLDAICVYFWATTPVMMSTLTFTVYIYLGGELNAAVVFTSLSLLNILIVPLNAFPWVLNGVIEAWISLKRVNSFTRYEEVDFLNRYSRELKENEIVIIQNGSFSWTADKILLKNINLTIKKGQLIGVSGSVGSGKSTFLSVILGEVQNVNGQMSIGDLKDGIGFVSQTPWIQQCSVRDNILFGRPYDAIRYNTVIEACALTDDLNQWPKGDLEIVGDGGSTLSGGQKARIALARAVYQDRSIYLLDDILSAVDRKVAFHIYQECVKKLLAGKTRVLVTHMDELFSSFDWLVFMENGIIKEQGSGQMVVVPSSQRKALQIGILKENHENFDITRDVEENHQEELEKEVSASGVVKFRIYYKYWKAVGQSLALVIVLSVIGMQASRIAIDWWLSVWVTKSTDSNKNITDFYYLFDFERNLIGDEVSNYKKFLAVFMTIGIVNSVIVIIRSFSYAHGGIRAAVKIHNQLLTTVTKARLLFFQVSPLGRILNRFSSDINTVDDTLPFDINILLAQIVGVIGTLLTTIYGIPWLCLFIAPLIPVYHWLQNQYRMTSRQLKRIISVTMSPLYSHACETLSGLYTIRAFREMQRFIRENEEKVDALQKCQLSALGAKAWLNIRFQMIGITIIGGVCILTALQRHFNITHSGFVGLAISYALTLTGSLGAVLNIFVETERKMVALERVTEYIENPKSESLAERGDIVLPFAWPSQGVVSFSNVLLQYREDSPYSLKDISFETMAGEKIGIVGRTGAGKSSLFNCLFRVHDIKGGSIHIDTINICDVSLKKLRSKMTIIPQDPFIFSDSVRTNLDPLRKVDDFTMWNVITTCGMAATIHKIGGLNAQLKADGENLSAGEKQLLCLLRAILKNSKVVCIDEATANMDSETEERIRDVMKHSFRGSTVLMIAHRPQSVMDCDRILVMSEGKILEFDTPQSLLQNPESHFYEIAHQDVI